MTSMRMRTRLACVACLLLAFSPIVKAFQEPEPPTPQEPPQVEKGADLPQETATVPLDDVVARLYHPVRAGLRDVTFEFRHQAFESSAQPFRKTRFTLAFKAPDKWKLDVKNLDERHELMAPRLIELLSWVHLFAGGVQILDVGLVPDRVMNVRRDGESIVVVTRLAEDEPPITLRFRDVDGKLRLFQAQSTPFGTLRLEWGKVEGIDVVTAIEILDTRTALGRWTLRCENLKVNQGVDDSVFGAK